MITLSSARACDSCWKLEPDFRIVGEAGDGLEAVGLVERLKPGGAGARPDDARPERPGRRAASQPAFAANPYRHSFDAGQRGIRVTGVGETGAAGYVLKQSTSDELVRAVRAVITGRRYLSPPLSERAIEIYLQKTEAAPLDVYETLTPREREVFHLAAEGCTNAEIAERLFISPRTVEVHRANMMRKLGLHNQADLIRDALRRGILPM